MREEPYKRNYGCICIWSVLYYIKRIGKEPSYQEGLLVLRRVVPYEEALLFLLSIQKQPTAGMHCMPVKYIKSDWEEQHDGHDHSGKKRF